MFNTGKGKEPPQANKEASSPMSKRISSVVGLAIMIAFFLVVIAVMGVGKSSRQSSSTPQDLYEPSAKNAQDLETIAKKNEVPLFPEEIEPEEMMPQIIYVPTPKMTIEEKRKSNHSIRLLAANASTTVGNFAVGTRQHNDSSGGGKEALPGTVAYELAQVEREIASAKQNEAMANQAMMAQNTGGQQNTDPNGWEAKERFIVGDKGFAGYSQHFRTPQRTELEVKAGTIIPCVLINGMISDLPGNCLAQITEDVYDSATGKNVLIPKGSKVVGTYDHRINYGQSRIMAVWTKLVYPDGSTLLLENLSGADPSGYTGYKGEVNRHWNSLIASAMIVSLLGAGADMVTPSNSGRNNDDNDAGNVLSENVARSVAEAMSKVIQREADRAPTIKIKPGKRFVLFVKRDVVFTEKWK